MIQFRCTTQQTKLLTMCHTDKYCIQNSKRQLSPKGCANGDAVLGLCLRQVRWSDHLLVIYLTFTRLSNCGYPQPAGAFVIGRLPT